MIFEEVTRILLDLAEPTFTLQQIFHSNLRMQMTRGSTASAKCKWNRKIRAAVQFFFVVVDSVAKNKSVVFTTTLIALSGFNQNHDHVVACLRKTVYKNYLCSVAANQQQIHWTRIRRNPHEHWITENS